MILKYCLKRKLDCNRVTSQSVDSTLVVNQPQSTSISVVPDARIQIEAKKAEAKVRLAKRRKERN